MSIAIETHITAASHQGFGDAVQKGMSHAARTLRGMRSAWVKDQNMVIDSRRVAEYRVNLKISFVRDD